MRLEHPQAGKVQQGAIFNCATVRGYERCPCYGIVLTARCDLAHAKYDVVNYLPVVRFSDWTTRDMCYILAKRMRKSVATSIAKALGQKKVSQYVLDTFPMRDIILKVTSGKEREQLLLKLDRLELIDNVSSCGGRLAPRGKELIAADASLCDGVVKELIQNKLTEYYFLDSVDVVAPSFDGYVVLLRHMRTLSPDIMNRIVKGLSEEDAAFDARVTQSLSFTSDPICMITGVLRSPDIEHLAQYFASVFVRIGLEDYEEDAVTHHQALAKG
jgi:hypothetical protein